MDPILLSLLAVLFTILSYVTYQAWKINKYWKEKGVPHVAPWLFLGNSAPILFMQKGIGERHHEICDKFPNEPVVGYYDFTKPVLLIRDAEMIEKVLIKDFIHFVDHGFPVDENENPFDSNLFTMTGKRWKAFRNKLSPLFTTGKLKMMYESMTESGDELIKQMDKLDEVEIREILGRFAMDVIGSCGFGMNPGNLQNPDTEFRRIGKIAFKMDLIQFIKFILITNFPALIKKLKITFNKKKVVKYFTGLIKQTVKYRRETGIKRNDFVQMMMQLQDKGFVEVHTKDPSDDYLNIDPTYSTEKFEITDDQITGQAFTFLTAGFEGTTITMMYTLYELSKHPEIQERVREEVQREVKQAGSLSYEAVRDMNYLEQCIKETTRKYPPSQALFRVCTKEYTLPNGLTIDPGQSILVATKAVHYHPAYYPDPEVYSPERFDPDRTVIPSAFLPFGNGPRICIAMRFAMMEMKYCIAKLLLNYRFSISPKTKEPLTLSVRELFTCPNEQIFFNIKKLTT